MTDTGQPGPQGKTTAEQARVAAEKMVAQLQVMIDQAGKTAGPILRDVAAKAAELTAVAAENAGPAAHKAADATGRAGVKLAKRSRELAVDLHKAAEAGRAAQAQGPKSSPKAAAKPKAKAAAKPKAKAAAKPKAKAAAKPASKPKTKP